MKKLTGSGNGIVTIAVVVCACLLLCLDMPAPALAQKEEQEAELKPDLTITAIKPYHYEWLEEYEEDTPPLWFGLTNYVEVTVANIGNDTAGSFVVTLYADDDGIERKRVEELPADPPDNTTDVIFEWVPEGEDPLEPLSWTDTAEGAICTYTDTSKTYTLKAVVDEANEVDEWNGENNQLTKDQKVVWNGYTADQPLENYVHDEVEGGIIYTTGDGQYRGRFTDGTEHGTYYDVNYDLDFSGSVKLARLYIHHTWTKPDHTAPKIGVTLTTPSGDTYDLSMEKSYNDIKGDFGAWWYVWGTYAYDITGYVEESGTYVVTVTNLNDGSDSNFGTEFAFAAPATLVVYEDTTAPKREYWINEGADILIGGRRGDGGFLDLDECRNTATFDGEHLDLEVKKATLGVVAAWGDDEPDDVLYFNGEELGEGVYCGYHDPWSTDETDEEIKGISMIIGKYEAQMGIAAFDVTDYLEDYDNEVIQGDDGDNMMPTNAFLVITYKEEGGEEEQIPPDIIPLEPVDTEINNIEGESRTFAISIDQTVDIVWQLNGTEVQTDEGVTEATYTNASAVLGTWNVSAIGTSRETGLSGIHTWIWNVTAAVGTTPTSAVNITSTPSPTPTPTATPASSVSATPTPTPTPTTATPRPEEKKKAAAEETKAPGFELAMSSFILIAVAYIRIRYKNKDKGKKKGEVSRK